MRRRKNLAIAGALAAGTFAATVALGASFGLFGLTQPDSPAGRLSGHRPPVTTTAAVPVRVDDGRLDDD
jgi:hypothetical protein